MRDSVLQREIRARLQSYLLGKDSLPTFHDWFAQTTSGQRRSGSADAMILTIELRLAEYKRGSWSEPQLRQHLRRLLPDTLQSSQSAARTWTASAVE
jgi:hypothetical protein